MDRAADYLQTSNNFTNEFRGYWQNSELSQFFSCFECLYRLSQEFISILDFCTNKTNTQCVFLCAPILREYDKHVCFEESSYREWYKVNKVYTLAPEFIRQKTECHFLKLTTIWHTWSVVR